MRFQTRAVYCATVVALVAVYGALWALERLSRAVRREGVMPDGRYPWEGGES